MPLDFDSKLVSNYHEDGREIAMGRGLGDEESVGDPTFSPYSKKNH